MSKNPFDDLMTDEQAIAHAIKLSKELHAKQFAEFCSGDGWVYDRHRDIWEQQAPCADGTATTYDLYQLFQISISH